MTETSQTPEVERGAILAGSEALLAIESSQRRLSVAVRAGGKIFEEREDSPQQAENLLPTVDRCLAAAGLKSSDIEIGIYSRGPGSFTSIRMAMSLLGALRVATGLRLIGVSSLASLARGAWRRQNICQVACCVDARGGEVYLGAYRFQEQSCATLIEDGIHDPRNIEPAVREGLAEILKTAPTSLAGDGWPRYLDAITASMPELAGAELAIDNELAGLRPSAMDLIELATTMGVDDPQPVYFNSPVHRPAGR